MDNENKQNHNFWIAYADLLAGLMFIFILLLGILVIKYVLTQNNLQNIQNALNEQNQNLIKNQNELAKKEKIVSDLGKKLQLTYDELNKQITQKEELKNSVNKHIQNEKELLLSYNQTNMQLEQASTKLENATKTIDEIRANIDEKDEKILILINELSNKEEKIKELNYKNEQTNIKLKHILHKNQNLINTLQSKLNGVNIDATGTLFLPASVLFDSGAYMLKQDAKEELKNTLNKYFDAILSDDNLYKNIENIIIEGHTDSDGSYMYNLDLSQKRAYEVMSFIYSFNADKRLQKLLMASGRSYGDPILKNGKEDKEASRRIEIKIIFSTKNLNKEINDFFTTNQNN